MDPLRKFGRDRAIWGTCAGAILLSSPAPGWKGRKGEIRLALMDRVVQRNAMGRQVESFRTELRVPAPDALGDGPTPFPSVFIRALILGEVNEASVEVLARLPDGGIVAARQGRLLATAFHPELTGDDRFHRYSLGLMEAHQPS